MVIQRVTQTMITARSLGNLQTSLGRLATYQEQLSTGRLINRPSDNPIGTTAAMRLRASLAEQAQYQRNAEDGDGWLRTIDATLTKSTEVVRRARDLALQGVNTSSGPQARQALAAEVEQLRQAMIGAANTSYLGRPVFGGITSGERAYDATGTFVGTTGSVDRTVARGVQVSVNVDAEAVFGPAGADLFADLDALASALRAGNQAGIEAGVTTMSAGLDRITAALSDVGTRAGRVERALQAAKDAQLDETTSLSGIENVDLAEVSMQLRMQEVAYQAALGATSRVIQPSLLDFLR